MERERESLASSWREHSYSVVLSSSSASLGWAAALVWDLPTLAPPPMSIPRPPSSPFPPAAVVIASSRSPSLC